jgi:hypothetical protein
MKILLIYPKFPDTFWSFNYAVGFIGKKAGFPPLGLLTVAALLPDLENGRPKRIYRAAGYSNLSQTPGPLWDLLETKRYASLSGLTVTVLPFFSARSILSRKAALLRLWWECSRPYREPGFLMGSSVKAGC